MIVLIVFMIAVLSTWLLGMVPVDAVLIFTWLPIIRYRNAGILKDPTKIYYGIVTWSIKSGAKVDSMFVEVGMILKYRFEAM